MPLTQSKESCSEELKSRAETVRNQLWQFDPGCPIAQYGLLPKEALFKLAEDVFDEGQLSLLKSIVTELECAEAVYWELKCPGFKTVEGLVSAGVDVYHSRAHCEAVSAGALYLGLNLMPNEIDSLCLTAVMLLFHDQPETSDKSCNQSTSSESVVRRVLSKYLAPDLVESVLSWLKWTDYKNGPLLNTNFQNNSLSISVSGLDNRDNKIGVLAVISDWLMQSTIFISKDLKAERVRDLNSFYRGKHEYDIPQLVLASMVFCIWALYRLNLSEMLPEDIINQWLLRKCEILHGSCKSLPKIDWRNQPVDDVIRTLIPIMYGSHQVLVTDSLTLRS